MSALTGKVAIVTGAGSGMGRQIARLLALQGAQVVAVGRSAEALEETRELVVAADGGVWAYPADITDAASMSGLVEWVHATLGPVDILVNNAGANCRVMNPQWLPDEQWNEVLDVNLTAVFRLSKLVLPDMLGCGEGTIVTVSSLAAVNPGLLGGAAYGAAKAGARNFMTFLHNTFRADGLRAITVLPGEADTPILENRPRPPEASERVAMLAPEDVAEAVVLAVTLPARACAQEIVVCPTRQRDTSADVALSRDIGRPKSVTGPVS
jgi:NADP-dependent 3-hydroxy acid dehydrogenase YdfG